VSESELVPKGPAPILLADADPISIAHLSALLSPHGEVRIARTLQRVRAALLDCTRLRAAVVDVGPPGGWSGLELIDELKRVHPGTPAVLLGGNSRPPVANAAFLMGVDYLERPVERACIERFMSARLPLARRIELRTEHWRDRYQMSLAQTDILRRAALGENRHTIAAFRSSSPNTVKRQIADLLQKTGDESLHSAIERVTREAVEA
jgi:DNA-binding NarL/FixJ family response regulator